MESGKGCGARCVLRGRTGAKREDRTLQGGQTQFSREGEAEAGREGEERRQKARMRAQGQAGAVGRGSTRTEAPGEQGSAVGSGRPGSCAGSTARGLRLSGAMGPVTDPGAPPDKPWAILSPLALSPCRHAPWEPPPPASTHNGPAGAAQPRAQRTTEAGRERWPRSFRMRVRMGHYKQALRTTGGSPTEKWWLAYSARWMSAGTRGFGS